MEQKDFMRVCFGFSSDMLFETKVSDVMNMEDGEGTPLPKDLADAIAKVGKIEYCFSTYPFVMESDEFDDLLLPTEGYEPKTYEDLVRPMCSVLTDIQINRKYTDYLHYIDGVWIEEIKIGLCHDGSKIGCTMELGS